jgi:hypothetical protein
MRGTYLRPAAPTSAWDTLLRLAERMGAPSRASSRRWAILTVGLRACASAVSARRVVLLGLTVMLAGCLGLLWVKGSSP